MSETTSRNNIFFPLTAIMGAAFVVTILAAAVAAFLADGRAPVAIFLNNYAGVLLTVEVGGILVLGVLAMAVDRRRTIRELSEQAAVAIEDETNTKGHES